MSCCKVNTRYYLGGLLNTFQQDTKLVSLPCCPTLTLENCADLGSWLLGSIGLMAFLAVKPFPSVVLGRITNNAVVSELICYTVICLSYVQFYHRIKAASEDHTLENRSAFNRDDKQYPYRTHGQLFRAYYGLLFCILLILFNNWRAFVSRSYNVLRL
jgi:amino acid permease